MPNAKLKTQSYQNLKGVNTKISPYLQGPEQFLNLVNFDFSTPGSLTKRPGSTQYLGNNASFVGEVQGLFEYRQTTGFSQIIYAHTGSIWAISASTITGLSLVGAGVTSQVDPYALNTFRNGSGAWAQTTLQNLYTPFSSVNIATSGFTPYYIYNNAATKNAGRVDFVNFQNFMFYVDGSNFLKWNGSQVFKVGLPAPTYVNSFLGASFETGPISLMIAGVSGKVDYFVAQFVNNRGFAGPFNAILSRDFSNGITDGSTFVVRYDALGIPVPLGFGISAVRFWCYTEDGPFNPVKPGANYGKNFTYQFDAATISATLANIFVGKLSNPQNPGYIFDPFEKGWLGATTFGGSLITESNLRVSQIGARFIEVYNNQIFLAGFAEKPSSFIFSDIGEPENYPPENIIEVRTNDGDSITCLQAFNSRLYVFKYNTFHELSGEDPDNFSVREISDQYGCVNNFSCAVFDDIMIWLDRRGIMRFNGANLNCISQPIQPIIDRINQAVAINTATAAHNPSRNEVVFGVPMDSSTYNNFTIVYDYLLDAWRFEENYNPALFSLIQGRLPNRALFYGGQTGMIFNFGASLMGDNGSAFTCLVKTRYLSDMGESIQKQFRRLYLNVDPISGGTIPIEIKAYPNYQNGASLTRVMYLTEFQRREEFGLSAKSLSFEFSHHSSTQGIRLHGWVIESRKQRDV